MQAMECFKSALTTVSVYADCCNHLYCDGWYSGHLVGGLGT